MNKMESPSQTSDEMEGLNLREVFDRYWHHKWLIAISTAIFLLGGYLFARYQQPVFESQASVLILTEQPTTGSPELGMLKDLGLTNGGGVLEDEIEKYKSRTLMETVVRDLNLAWSYENIGTKTGIVRGEFYDKCPVEVRSLESDHLLSNRYLDMEIVLESPEYYTIKKGGPAGRYAFGSVLKTHIGKLIISKTPFFAHNMGNVIGIKLQPLMSVVENFQRAISVEPVNKESNIIVLKIKGANSRKNDAILNELIAAHQKQAIDNKNEIVRNTTKFINERMKYIAIELSDVEKEGESFKTKHQLIDVSTDAASYLEKESNLEQKVIETTIEKNLVSFMGDFLKEQKGYDQLLPANLGFSDLSIVEMTTKYNELVLERNRLLEMNGGKNPNVGRVESQLASLRSSLEISLKNLDNSLNLQLKKLSNEEAVYQSKISSIPSYERAYRDIFRQQQIKETLYLFLLQKREENEISLAATVSNSEVIDAAYSNPVPIAPKKKIIYLGALLLGLLLPVVIIYLKNLLNTKVQSRGDVESLGLRVLAELPQSRNSDELFVINKPGSSLAEAFRVLRSGLSFILPAESEGGKVISITSSIGGEGKTLTSVNLAFMYATIERRVCIVGLDLRKPRLLESLGLTSSRPGMSEYLSNPKVTVGELLEDVERNQYKITIISSGVIPPNPSELLLSPRLDELVSELRKQFDIIILDNAPVGLVIDAVTVNRVSDATLYLIRAHHVDKRMLPRILASVKEAKLKRMYTVLNGVKQGKGGYYSYGYGEETSKKKWWMRK